jgi:phosphopantetheinyl transferase
MIFRKTPEGRPYLVSPPSSRAWSSTDVHCPQVSSQLPRFDYNISHDADWVVMGWTWSDTDQARIGIDVMKLRNPWSDTTLDDFYQGIQEYVSLSSRSLVRVLTV